MISVLGLEVWRWDVRFWPLRFLMDWKLAANDVGFLPPGSIARLEQGCLIGQFEFYQ